MQIEITPAAEKFIRRMIRIGNVPDGGGFRLAVSPGGCSGLEAKFGLKLFLPAESRLLLEGVTIDCADSPTESGFVFRDPKSRGSACGTPSSATVQLVNLATPPGVRG